MKPNPQHSRYWVPMVDHTFRALEAFEDANTELSLQEISTRAGISKSSAYRILFTLENLGYVNKNPSILHATAIGKSIAAFQDRSTLKKLMSLNPFKRFTPHSLTRRPQFMKSLEEVRLRGYSLEEEEIELGACCVAAPILNNAGVAVAAMSIAGPAPRIRQKQQAIIDGLRKASAEISARLELP